MLAYLEKMKDILFILVVTAIYSVMLTLWEVTEICCGFYWCLVLVMITVVGIVISWLPGFKFSNGLLGIDRCCGGFHAPIPLSDWILAQTKNVGFLSITTPILAYGGLCLGKDLQAFKQLSWRIVPVALAVAAGSFICATALAEIMLHLEGIF